MDDPRWSLIIADHQVIYKGAAYHWSNAQRDDHSLILKVIRQGQLPFQRDQQGHQVSPGEALHFRHGENSSYGWPQPAPEQLQLTWFSFTGAGAAAHWDWLDQRSSGQIAHPASPSLIQKMDELVSLHRQNPQRRDLGPRIYAAINEYAVCQEMGRTKTMSPLQQALERLTEQPLSIDNLSSLANEAGVSREHLSRCFQQQQGISPSQYLSQARLRHASFLLRESDLSVDAIAQLCGFHSANALARALRQHSGKGPRKLRQEARGL